ncbi:hypothetical protein SCA6_016153 [Theobroma cacao]
MGGQPAASTENLNFFVVLCNYSKFKNSFNFGVTEIQFMIHWKRLKGHSFEALDNMEDVPFEALVQ